MNYKLTHGTRFIGYSVIRVRMKSNVINRFNNYDNFVSTANVYIQQSARLLDIYTFFIFLK